MKNQWSDLESPGKWSLFDKFLIRSAGLPYDWLQHPHPSDLDKWLTCAAAIRRQQAKLRPHLLRELRQGAGIATAGHVRQELRKARRQVIRGRPVDWSSDEDELGSLLGQWNELLRARDSATTNGATAWRFEVEVCHRHITHVAREDAFQEAVFLNSPSALAGVRRLLDGRGVGKTRRLAWKYLQRFCAKSDTGGHYGPVNLGFVEPNSDMLLIYESVGDGRASTRKVSLSYWATQKIVDIFSSSLSMAPYLRLSRTARLRPETQSVGDPELLELADGTRNIGQVAAQLGVNIEHVADSSERLSKTDWVRRELRISPYAADPLEGLVQLFPSGRLPAPVAECVDFLKKWTAAFEHASLLERIHQLDLGESYFQQLTGSNPRRGGGETRVDRLVFSEEGIRNLRAFKISQTLATLIESSLGTCLDVLATEAISERERGLQRLRSKNADEFSQEIVDPLGLNDPSSLAEDLSETDRYRTQLWKRVIPDPAVDVVNLDRETLISAGLIRSDLDDWPLYCAPDVCIAASDIEALNAGNFQLILSEVHHIMPLIMLPLRALGSDVELGLEALRVRIRDLVAPAIPTLLAVERTNKVMDHTPLGHALLFVDWIRSKPNVRAIPAADLRVKPGRNGKSTIVDARTGQQLALFPVYPEYQPGLGILRHFAMPGIDKRPIDLGLHTPRIVIDGVIFQRRSWRFEVSDIQFAERWRCTFEDVLEVREWRDIHSLPEEVFVRLSGESRPLLVDFRDPLSCDVFAHALRQSERVSITEMDPNSKQLWLKAGEGSLVNELRLTMFRLPDESPPKRERVADLQMRSEP